AGKSVALTAPGLAERGLTRLEGTSLFNAVERWQKILQLPFTNERLLRLHVANPIAEERDRPLIHHRGHQRRHLPSPATRHALEKNGPLEVAGSNKHGVIDAESVV